MEHGTEGLVRTLMALPIFQSEWVLWLLIILSVVSVGIMIERVYFYYAHKVPDFDELRAELKKHLDQNDFVGAARLLKPIDSLETNVVLFGLKDFEKGPDAVEDLINGALRREKARYDQRLSFLAIVASNAPFVGLFGTVLGIIKAFKELDQGMAENAGSVMGGIAEALIATAVGLLVAIPAIVAFNTFRGSVKKAVDNTHLLAKTVLAQLKAL